MPDKTKWSTSAGSLSATNGTSTWFTAPSFPTTAIITIKAGQVTKTYPFNVLKPTGIDHADIVSLSEFIDVHLGAGMTLNAFIAPTSVSFYQVQFLEVGENASNKSGWYSLTVSNSFLDRAQLGSSDCPPVGSAGGFAWDIPARWKIENGPTNTVSGWSEVFSVDAAGTTKVTKFGHTVTRHQYELTGSAQ
jgi:hypothetical protein